MFPTKTKAFTLAFMAIILPSLLMVGALVIESGNLYVRHTEIQNLAKQAANSGLLAFSNILQREAEIAYYLQCNVEEPPKKCSKNLLSLFDFLTPNAIGLLVNNAHYQTQVQEATKDFAQTFDPQKSLKEENIQVSFPENYVLGTNKIEIRVFLSQDIPNILRLMSDTSTISAQSRSYLPLY